MRLEADPDDTHLARAQRRRVATNTEPANDDAMLRCSSTSSVAASFRR